MVGVDLRVFITIDSSVWLCFCCFWACFYTIMNVDITDLQHSDKKIAYFCPGLLQMDCKVIGHILECLLTFKALSLRKKPSFASFSHCEFCPNIYFFP